MLLRKSNMTNVPVASLRGFLETSIFDRLFLAIFRETVCVCVCEVITDSQMHIQDLMT